MLRKRHLFWNFFVALLFLVFAGKASHATTITVVNLNDSGAGSLRQTIAAAVAGDTVNFAVTGTITLTSGELTINKNLIITGPSASKLTISGRNASRIFYIYNSPVNGPTVTISGLTFRDGNSRGSGGAIYNDNGQLMVSDSAFTNNNCINDGGAIFNSSHFGDSKTLSLTNCTFNNNIADYRGGAVFTRCYSNKTIWSVKNCTFNNNSADSGGAIYASVSAGDADTSVVNTSLTVDSSTFVNNSSAIGAECTDAGNLTVAVNNSVLNGNYGYSGAALSNAVISGKIALTVSNSILSNNGGPEVAFSEGGAINNYASVGDINLTLNNSTLSNNKAAWRCYS